MPFITKNGLFSMDLRSTCYILACFFMLWNIIVGILGILDINIFITYAEPIVHTITSVLLMAGILIENRWLLIPWMLGIFFSLALAIYFVVCKYPGEFCFVDSTYTHDNERIHIDNILFFVYYWLKLLIELIVVRYILSYCIHIERDEETTETTNL